MSNIITEVRVAPAHKMHVKSGSNLVLSDLTCMVRDGNDGLGNGEVSWRRE